MLLAFGVVLLVGLPLARLAAAADTGPGPWTQAGGDEHHSSLADVGRATLDVVRVLRLVPEGQRVADGGDFAVAAVGSQAYYVGVAGPACSLYRLDVASASDAAAAEASPLGAPFACPNGARLVAYDDATQHLLVCIDGPANGSPASGLPGTTSTAVHLQAFGLDGAPAWTLSPAPDVTDLTSVLGQAQQDGIWSCRGPALSGPLAYVPFASDTGQNAIEAVTLATGKQAWAARVPASAFLPNVTFPIPNLPAPPSPGGVLPSAQPGGFVPTSATVTDGGIVVSGRLGGAAASGSPPGIVWFGNDGSGNILGASTITSGQTPAVTTGTTTPASVRAAARGPSAAQLIGDRLYVVNPAVTLQAEPRSISGASGSTDLPGLAWTRDGILVPVDSGIFLVDKSARVFAQWIDDDTTAHVQQVIATPSTQALVLVTHAGGDRPRAELVRVGLRDSLRTPVIDRIPLPLLGTPGDGLSLHMIPLGTDRILAWDTYGNASLLDAAPSVAPVPFTVDGDYPEPQAQLTLKAGVPDDPRVQLLLSWGDEYPEPGLVQAGESVTHTYAEAGDHDIRLTAVYPDNRTATASHTVHVGGTPPDCGFICVAFRPQNQNYTFFGIGLFITLVGAGFTGLAATRGRRRLERYLRELDRIRQEGRAEPLVGIRDLHTFRAGLRTDLGKGRLHDGQFALIDRQASEILTLLRQRILGAFLGRVGETFRHTLDLALLDGVVEENERDALIEAAHKEKGLSTQERARLVDIIRSWALP